MKRINKIVLIISAFLSIVLMLNMTTSCNKPKINEDLIGYWRLDSVMTISSKTGIKDTGAGYAVVQFKEDNTISIAGVGIIVGTYELKGRTKITAKVQRGDFSGTPTPHWHSVLMDILNYAVSYKLKDDQLTIYKSDDWVGKLTKI